MNQAANTSPIVAYARNGDKHSTASLQAMTFPHLTRPEIRKALETGVKAGLLKREADELGTIRYSASDVDPREADFDAEQADMSAKAARLARLFDDAEDDAFAAGVESVRLPVEPAALVKLPQVGDRVNVQARKSSPVTPAIVVQNNGKAVAIARLLKDGTMRAECLWTAEYHAVTPI